MKVGRVKAVPNQCCNSKALRSFPKHKGLTRRIVSHHDRIDFMFCWGGRCEHIYKNGKRCRSVLFDSPSYASCPGCLNGAAWLTKDEWGRWEAGRCEKHMKVE